MGIGDALPERIVVKIGGSGPHAEPLSRQIYRVRAIGNGETHFFQIPRRGEQFRTIIHRCPPRLPQ